MVEITALAKFIQIVISIIAIIFVVVFIGKAFIRIKNHLATLQEHLSDTINSQDLTNVNLQKGIDAINDTIATINRFIKASRNESHTLREFMMKQETGLSSIKKDVSYVDRKVTRLAKIVNVDPKDLSDAN